MVHDNLVESISAYIPLTDKDIKLIKEVFKKREYKKKENLLEQGELTNNIFFVEKGLVRVFYTNDEGNEVNTHFASDNYYLTSFQSFVSQEESNESIQAIQDTTAFLLPYQEYIRDDEFINKFRQAFVEQNVICIKKRADLLQTSTAKERYEHFLNNSDKKIIMNVPLVHIASYLGITPESLSRIRKG